MDFFGKQDVKGKKLVHLIGVSYDFNLQYQKGLYLLSSMLKEYGGSRNTLIWVASSGWTTTTDVDLMEGNPKESIPDGLMHWLARVLGCWERLPQEASWSWCSTLEKVDDK